MHPLTNKTEWLAKHRASCEALEAFRVQELMAMTEERAREIMAMLSIPGEPWRENPEWSGLVDQQAIFRRGHKK